MNNVRIMGNSGVKLQGFQANTGGFGEPAFPLVMSLNNVVADSPLGISMTSSDAILTIQGVNLPIVPSTANRITVNGTATLDVDPTKVVDCSMAFVDFPAIGASNLFGSHWGPQ
jgi:hypothetical protein